METRTANSTNLEKLLTDMRTLLKDGEELLKVSMSRMRQKARVGAERTDLAVHEHPYYSIGLMFGVGLLAGVVIAESLRSRRRTEDDEDY